MHFKALLLLDNTPVHITHSKTLDYLNIKTMFLTKYYVPLPTYGVCVIIHGTLHMRCSHSCYQHLRQLKDTLTMLSFWKIYAFMTCTEVIKEVWDNSDECLLAPTLATSCE